MTHATKALFVFGVGFTITAIGAVVAVFINGMFPDIRFNDPVYMANYIGIKELVSVIKALDIYDFYATFITGIGSVVSFALKKLGY